MYLTLFFAVLFLISIPIDIIRLKKVSFRERGLTWTFGVIFAISLFLIPVSLEIQRVQIERFEARKTTIIEQRNNNRNQYERVMLTETIVDDNSWLAMNQARKNRKSVNWYVPKEILDVEPIK